MADIPVITEAPIVADVPVTTVTPEIPATVTTAIKQNRFKSWALWVSVAGAIWLIGSAFGLPAKIGISNDAFSVILNAIGTILVGFGIVNNPTDSTNI